MISTLPLFAQVAIYSLLAIVFFLLALLAWITEKNQWLVEPDRFSDSDED